MRKNPKVKREAIRDRLALGQSSWSIAHELGVSKIFYDNIRMTMHSGTPKAKSGAPNKLSLQSKN